MLIVRFCFKFFSYLLVLLLAGLWLKPHASFTHNTVGSVPWLTKGDSSSPTSAKTEIQQLERGQFVLKYATTLQGISPRQLIWFIKNQAHYTAELDGNHWQWFQLSHPNSHSELIILDSPEATSNRLMPGATFEEKELLNQTQWRMRLKVRSFGEQGMTFDVLHAGYRVGQLNYVFYPTSNGTKITFDGQLGLTLPVIGDISNFYLFKKVMPEYLLEAWLLHNLETYQHMEKLIPILHQQQLHQKGSHKRFLIS